MWLVSLQMSCEVDEQWHDDDAQTSTACDGFPHTPRSALVAGDEAFSDEAL